MNAQVYQVTLAQAQALGIDTASAVFMINAKPALVGMYKNKPLCFFGANPDGIYSTSAYLWMHVTEEGHSHRLVLARRSAEVIAKLCQIYSEIYGHCFSERSQRWLKYLGAEFTDTTFVIRGSHG